ncbi:nuclear transport factor 2 family protein [Micromonospora sp. URMC 106]|uniref:nuclear transport factor 2 family protein n=1 Tax=Micromonospora sp. URMC 106 TaxID=3423408 RepID=UPI003F1E33B9
MRARTIIAVTAAVVLAGAAIAMMSSDHMRAVAEDAVTPLPVPTGSQGPLDPAAQRYFDAVSAKDPDAVAAAFAADAVVVDVGREIRGRDAIRRWAEREVVGGVYTLLGHTPHPDGVTVLVRFQPGGVGGFRANYRLTLTDGLISRADLEYA